MTLFDRAVLLEARLVQSKDQQEGVDLLIAEHKKHPSNPYILLSRHFGFWVTVWVKRKTQKCRITFQAIYEKSS